MKKSELTEIIREVIKETIRKVDGKYVVYPEKGGKRLGTHSTKKAAEKQLTAIHLNKMNEQEMSQDDFNTIGDILRDSTKAKQIHTLLLQMFPQQKELLNYNYKNDSYAEFKRFIFHIDKYKLEGPTTIPYTDLKLDPQIMKDRERKYQDYVNGKIDKYFRDTDSDPRKVDLSKMPPITVDQTGEVMDGNHRAFLAIKQQKPLKGYKIVNANNTHPNVAKILQIVGRSVQENYTDGKIAEAKQVGNLYHYTSAEGLKSILTSNSLNASQENYLGKELQFVSFTRNKNFHNKGQNFNVKTDYRITLDGDKLSSKYKIKPFAYIPGWDYTDNWEYDWLEDEPESVRRDFFNATGEYDEQEERISFKDSNGSIPNIKDYILKVDKVSDLQENYADGKVKEAFSPSPLQNLVNDYLFFITMNFTHLEKTGKSPQDVDALTQMIRQAKVDVDKLKDLSKDQLEKNKNSILQRIHDMLTYIISRMKAHMRPEEYEKRRDRLNKLLALYKDAAKVQENYADGKVKGKSRPGRVKKSGASCKGSVTDLRAKAKKYGGEKGKMYHWCANMKGGKN